MTSDSITVRRAGVTPVVSPWYSRPGLSGDDGGGIGVFGLLLMGGLVAGIAWVLFQKDPGPAAAKRPAWGAGAGRSYSDADLDYGKAQPANSLYWQHAAKKNRGRR